MHGLTSYPVPYWAAMILMAVPCSARAQDGDTDSIPDPEPPLDGPHDPFGLGVKKLGYSVALKAAEVYDDNLFLTSDDQVSDFITVFLLTTKARFDHGAGTAAATYRGRERIFSSHDELNGPEHFVDVTGDMKVGNWKFDAALEYQALKDPFDALQTTERVDSEYDREHFKAAGEYGRFGIELNVARVRFTVDDEALDRGDYLRWEGSATGVAIATAKLHLLLTVGGWATEYDEPIFSDFEVVQVWAGARFLASARTHFEAAIGYARAEPDGDPTAVPFEDFSEVVGHLTGVWVPQEHHEVTVALHRAPVESVNSGLALSTEVRLGYRYTIPDRGEVRLGLYWERRDESFENESRRGLGLRAGGQWDFAHRFFTDGGILLRSRDSDEPDEDYENLRISIGLGVRL